MFSLIRDLYLELSGVDSVAAEEERLLKREEKKKKRFIFSGGAKTIIFIFGALYFLVSVLSLVAMIEAGALSFGKVLRPILLSGIDVACLVCLAIGTKKTEIAALILAAVFAIALYFSTMIL